MFTQVWDRLFIGGIGDALEIAESNAFEIATVIPLCSEPIRVRRGGVNYLNYPAVEAHPMPTGWLGPIFDALFENIRWGRVLVAGIGGSRLAPVIAAAWMHAVGYMDIDAALVDIGKACTLEPSTILLRSAKQALK